MASSFQSVVNQAKQNGGFPNAITLDEGVQLIVPACKKNPPNPSTVKQIINQLITADTFVDPALQEKGKDCALFKSYFDDPRVQAKMASRSIITFEGTKPEQPYPVQEIKKTIEKNRIRTKACYEQALRDNPNLSGGRVTVDFTIGVDGKLTQAAIDQGTDRYLQQKTTINDKKMQDCLLKVIRSIQFPPSPNGKSVQTSYPFNFLTT